MKNFYKLPLIRVFKNESKWSQQQVGCFDIFWYNVALHLVVTRMRNLGISLIKRESMTRRKLCCKRNVSKPPYEINNTIFPFPNIPFYYYSFYFLQVSIYKSNIGKYILYSTLIFSCVKLIVFTVLWWRSLFLSSPLIVNYMLELFLAVTLA